ARRPSQAVPGKGGNLVVDWIPADGQGGKKEISVDPTRHCIHLAMTSLKHDERRNDGIVRLDLERGRTYTVTASGEAFMSSQTGNDADPFPGVVLLYGSDEEDGYAIRQTVLAPGKSITFRSPWAINPEDDVYLMAFFLDIDPDSPNRGRYQLTVEQAGESVDSRRGRADELLRQIGKPGDSASRRLILELLKESYHPGPESPTWKRDA